jgi:phosphotransferase system enzyme I (PtsP)
MFPMVATVDEFDRAKSIVEREINHLERYGHGLPNSIKLGVMVEVPSLLFEIDEISQRADFLSVGSNDLMQFLFAADRENPMMAARFDPLSPSCLRALKKIADAGSRAGIPVTLCGELGGRPIEAMTLIGLGYRSLSMSPASIGPVKAMLIELEAAGIANHIGTLLEKSNGAPSLRPQIESFAQANGIPV